jgi:hypothetical protein
VDGVKGPGKCMNSFTAVTPVLLADGTSKPIGDIKVGDKVLSTDPETGEDAAEEVEVLHDNLDHDFVDLTVKLADGTTSVINTTRTTPSGTRATVSGRTPRICRSIITCVMRTVMTR